MYIYFYALLHEKKNHTAEEFVIDKLKLHYYLYNFTVLIFSL